MLGGPFSGWLLDSTSTFGFKNWQFMFIVQGVLTVLVGLIAFFVLVSKPDDAKWLNTSEKNLLNRALEVDQPYQDTKEQSDMKRVFSDWRVWRFVFIYFSIQMSVYGVLFYFPSKLAALLNMHIGLTVGYYSAIPWILTLILLPIMTRIADKKSNWNSMAIFMLSCAVMGIGLSTQMVQVIPFILMISLAVAGFIIVQPLFWNLPTQYLTGRSAAIGTALIGAMGNLGGFVAPNLKNWADQLWNNDIAGLVVLAAVGFIGVILLWLLKHDQKMYRKPLTRSVK